MEIYTSPLPPTPTPDLGYENSTFGFCAALSLICGGGGRVGGAVGLLFPFILSKIVVKIVVKMTVVRGKICVGR